MYLFFQIDEILLLFSWKFHFTLFGTLWMCKNWNLQITQTFLRQIKAHVKDLVRNLASCFGFMLCLSLTNCLGDKSAATILLIGSRGDEKFKFLENYFWPVSNRLNKVVPPIAKNWFAMHLRHVRIMWKNNEITLKVMPSSSVSWIM